MREEWNLDYAEAQRAIAAIVAEVAMRGKAAVVAVADSHGELISMARMDGAALSSITIACNKAYTAVRACKATFELGKEVRDATEGFDISYYGDPRICGWGGGVPVKKDGRIVGSVAVSGLPQAEDMEVVELGVAAIGA